MFSRLSQQVLNIELSVYGLLCKVDSFWFSHILWLSENDGYQWEAWSKVVVPAPRFKVHPDDRILGNNLNQTLPKEVIYRRLFKYPIHDSPDTDVLMIAVIVGMHVGPEAGCGYPKMMDINGKPGQKLLCQLQDLKYIRMTEYYIRYPTPSFVYADRVQHHTLHLMPIHAKRGWHRAVTQYPIHDSPDTDVLMIAVIVGMHVGPEAGIDMNWVARVVSILCYQWMSSKILTWKPTNEKYGQHNGILEDKKIFLDANPEFFEECLSKFREDEWKKEETKSKHESICKRLEEVSKKKFNPCSFPIRLAEPYPGGGCSHGWRLSEPSRDDHLDLVGQLVFKELLSPCISEMLRNLRYSEDPDDLLNQVCTTGFKPEHAPTPKLENVSVVFLPSLHQISNFMELRMACLTQNTHCSLIGLYWVVRDLYEKDGLHYASETRATANESDLLDNLPHGKAIDSIFKEFTSKFNKHLIAYVYLMHNTNNHCYPFLLFTASTTISVHQAKKGNSSTSKFDQRTMQQDTPRGNFQSSVNDAGSPISEEFMCVMQLAGGLRCCAHVNVDVSVNARPMRRLDIYIRRIQPSSATSVVLSNGMPYKIFVVNLKRYIVVQMRYEGAAYNVGIQVAKGKSCIDKTLCKCKVA
ncbi:protein phosphatase 2A regulatory B subunit family protein [Artemisia annua]|uniref:Protein phosphatase 2A regulatory B subunit family protein n=1 Tax=Artemisia annua TaxID=35608 RepID=A0A2U1Q1N5_ARTAN|nr:protein phosphatase 2A regulatory B subunit family protein [Artemisia annua]